MNLDGESTYCCNDIDGIALDTILRECGVEFPDCCCCLDSTDAGYHREDVGDGEVEDVGKAWESLSAWVEGIDGPAVEERLDRIAHRVIVARVVGCHTEQLGSRTNLNE